MHLDYLQTSVKQLTPSGLRPLFSVRQTVDCPLQVESELLPQIKDFKFLRSLFTNNRTGSEDEIEMK